MTTVKEHLRSAGDSKAQVSEVGLSPSGSQKNDHREGLRNPQGTRVSVRERLHARRVFPIHYLRVRTHATRRPAHECGVALALRAERTCVLCWAQVRFHKTQVRFSRAQMRCAQSANALPRERKCVSNRPHLRATFGVICGARHLACPRHLVCRTFLPGRAWREWNVK